MVRGERVGVRVAEVHFRERLRQHEMSELVRDIGSSTVRVVGEPQDPTVRSGATSPLTGRPKVPHLPDAAPN